MLIKVFNNKNGKHRPLLYLINHLINKLIIDLNIFWSGDKTAL